MKPAFKENMKVLFHTMLFDSRKGNVFGRFPGLARLSFWQEQHADEDECRPLVEW
jgi:hypothetical protein